MGLVLLAGLEPASYGALLRMTDLRQQPAFANVSPVVLRHHGRDVGRHRDAQGEIVVLRLRGHDRVQPARAPLAMLQSLAHSELHSLILQSLWATPSAQVLRQRLTKRESIRFAVLDHRVDVVMRTAFP